MVYRIEAQIAVTAYVRADTAEEATVRLADFINFGLELVEDESTEPPISGRRFDDPKLPDISLSPVMTFMGLFPGSPVEPVED